MFENISLPLMAAGGVLALAILIWLLWFTFRAGQDRANVNRARTEADAARTITQKTQAMAQAQANKPATAEALMDRLNGGTA